MLCWVIRDYIGAFRWQNIKEQYKYGVGFFAFNIMINVPIISTGYSMNERTLASFLVNLPIAFALFTTMLQPMALPKMMYLSPMSRDMRREYIIKSCLVRMAVPILIGLPGLIWMLASGIFDWLCGIGILLNTILTSVLLGRGNNALAYAKWRAQREPSTGLDDVLGFRQLVTVVITIVLNIIYVAAIAEGDLWWVKLILIGVILLTSLPITVWCMKEWPQAIDAAVFYESSSAM